MVPTTNRQRDQKRKSSVLAVAILDEAERQAE